jgi:hypothetical protein
MSLRRVGGIAVVAAGLMSASLTSAAVADPVPPGTVPDTVQVGNQTVSVPATGVIAVGGESVPVLPGAKRVVLVSPPPDSTSSQDDGVTVDQLPAGAAGANFSLLPANSTAGTVPSSIIPEGASPDALPGACEMFAHEPSPNGGQQTVKGTVSTDCSSGDVVWVEVTATLYWSAGDSPFDWVKQNPTKTEADVYDATATATHSCTKDTTHYWHVRNDTLVEDEDTGDEYSDHLNSPNGFLHCT